MMKVLLVIRWPVGGIRTFINYVYANFNSDEIELYFVLPNLPEVKMLQDKMTSLRCTWHITQTDRPSPLEISTLTIKAALKHNVDIIHAHGFTSAIAVGWFLPFLSQPSVFTSHDILQANQFSGFKGKCKKWLMTVLLNRFSKIHSVSHDRMMNQCYHC
ncbi:MAG: hypothetical protein EOO07_05040 [Chitinophagaceae bacterium]|nr:MAG: hypothetical protein EOO07_05040 [Chitinophagaceae bacterium]